MRRSTVKKGLAALGLLLALVAAFVAALPWLASNRIVRDRIAYELSLWSGYRVSIGEGPVLDVWPGFRAILHDVSFHEWGGGSNPPVLEADRMEVTLSALSALRGNVVLSSASMHRPLLRLTIEGSVIDLPASPGGGRMTRAVEAARKLVGSNPANPDRSGLPADAFGTVEFTDGRIAIVDGDAADVVTSLNGRVVWPSLNRSVRVTATGIWRGEQIAVEGTSAEPLMLMAGGNAPVNVSLKSPLLGAAFEGTANLAGDAYFDGQASLSSPSLRRMLEWSKTQIAPGAAIGAVSVAGRVQGTARRLRVDSAALTIGGNSGRGVLDVSFANASPAFSGTLAFDKLDLRSFLAAFSPMAAGGGDIDDPIDTGFAEQLSLDLRLSAAAATLGDLALTDLAASAQVKRDLAVFDISDATVFGGVLQAGLRIDAAGVDKAVEMRVMASDVDAFALAKAAGVERLLPQGRATISAVLKGTGAEWSTVMARAEGTVAATLGQGALVGVDIARFRERWGGGGFFPLSDVGGGSLPLRGFDFKATVSGGIARIEKAEALLEREVIAVSGIIPYFSRALALSGHFSALEANDERAEPEMPFFIGGGWEAPFVSPALPAADHE